MKALYPYLMAVTDFGDSGFLFAIAMTVAVYMALRGTWRPALVFMFVLLSAAAGVGVLKIIFISCEIHQPYLTVRSPSGHAAMAAAVLGALAAVVSGTMTGWRRAVPALIALAAIAAIAATRVALGFHNIAEVVIGLSLGGLVAVFAHFLLRRERPLERGGIHLTLALLLMAVLVYGTHWRVEPFMERWASDFGYYPGLCGAAGQES